MINEKGHKSETKPQESLPQLPLSQSELQLLVYAYPVFLTQAQESPAIDWSDTHMYTLSEDLTIQTSEPLHMRPEVLMQELDRLFTDKLSEYQEQRTQDPSQAVDSWTFGTDGYMWHIAYTPLKDLKVMRRKEVVDLEGEIYAQEEHFSLSLSNEPSVQHIDRTVVKDDQGNFSIDGDCRLHEAGILAIERAVESLRNEPNVDLQTDQFTAAFVAMAEIIIDLMPHDDYEDWRQKRDTIVPLLLRSYRFFWENPFPSSDLSDTEFDTQLATYTQPLEEILQQHFQDINTDILMMYDDFGIEGEHDHNNELSASAHHSLQLLSQLGTFTYQAPRFMFGNFTKHEIQSIPSETPLSYLVAQLSDLRALDLLGDTLGLHMTLAEVLLDQNHLEATYLTEILYSFGIFNRLFFKEDLEKMLHTNDALNESWTKPELIDDDLYVWWVGHQPRFNGQMKAGKKFGTQVRYLPVSEDDWDQDISWIFRHFHIGSIAIRAFQKSDSDRSHKEQLLSEDWEWYMTEWKNLLASVAIQELPDNMRFIELTRQEVRDLMAEENRKATAYDRFVTKIFLTSYANPEFRNQGIDLTLMFQDRVLQHASLV